MIVLNAIKGAYTTIGMCEIKKLVEQRAQKVMGTSVGKLVIYIIKGYGNTLLVQMFIINMLFSGHLFVATITHVVVALHCQLQI